MERFPGLPALLGVEPVPPKKTVTVPEPVRPTARTARQELVALRSASEPSERVRAARALATIAEPDVTAALILALRDSSAEVGVEAADALQNHPGRDTIDALGTVLENRDGYFSAMTRAAAVRSLAALLPEGEDAVIAGVLSHVDAEVSLSALSALVQRAEPSGALALLGILEDSRGYYLPLVRRAAAQGLLRLRLAPPERISALLSTEVDDAVREALVRLIS
jgi:HEAT repeat protein